MMNQKGSTLLLVLIISTVFMILGLSILTLAINGSSRTQMRSEAFGTMYKGKEELEFIVATFKGEVDDPDNIKLSYELSIDDYNNSLKDILDKLKDNYPDLSVTDQSSSFISESERATSFTRIFEFSLPAESDTYNKKVKKRVILTPAPSFLDYALGSYGLDEPEGNLDLNGSSNIKGSIIANKLSVKNSANFKDKLGNRITGTSYPGILGDVFVQNGLSLYNYPAMDPVEEISVNKIKSINDLQNYFYLDSRPSFQRLNEEFVEVQFDQSFLFKFNEQLNLNKKFVLSDIQDEAELTKDLNKELSFTINNGDIDRMGVLKLDGNVLSKPIISKEAIQIMSNDQTITFKHDIIVTDDLTITSINNNPITLDGDIVVVGDLEFNAYNVPIYHRGTITVLGNLRINGNDVLFNNTDNNTVYFDSTIYNWKESLISNINIKGWDDKQLVLLSRDNITITRINDLYSYTNQYENSGSLDEIMSDSFQNNTVSPLDAYFYTEKKAELYGVGSLFYINGGVFAKESLEVNAVRGNIAEVNEVLSIPDALAQSGRKTRFQVIHDPNVLLEQVSRLPLSEKLRVIVDESTIE
ncbi:hypothetical protein LC085_02370 [Bacillus tianshenii]|uniref:hypothetical protein n=1 Tax=Sutcliffiella tianshenii TaxID=1463404 RepID=UPI001CD8045C|nr:hypothetical protein [Bacillus tianshenii]MCA1318740.1 hypothetical protein [Bacillus tianshenii]